MRRILTGLLVLAVAALPASAAKLTFKNGTTVNCKVTAYDSATKTLSVRLDDGTAKQLNISSSLGFYKHQPAMRRGVSATPGWSITFELGMPILS